MIVCQPQARDPFISLLVEGIICTIKPQYHATPPILIHPALVPPSTQLQLPVPPPVWTA
ncbi:hypothetical protein K438DRAFT_1876167 [Mycena galopus ATCC 62051]|nr:hypothetical protein K438DRAFT_1895151 [Mycena galopus ATCC 62051]KAF8143331.1 hypothetical protein K438DRAFT_1876167 [Mycena galopus ATCC 62051]